MKSTHARTLIYVGTSLLAVLVIVYFFWIRPNQQLNDTKASLTAKDFIELKSGIRSGLAQALGGAALLIGLAFTWRNIRATEKNLIIAQENIRATQETAAQNLKVAIEGQITERFTRAVEQLGNKDRLAIRLGGIYGLERIAQDSKRDHWSIVELLSAFVRDTAALEKGKPREVTPLTDVKAVLTVLSRRDRTSEKNAPRLNLAGLDLREYPLSGCSFEKADLSGSDFSHAVMVDAKFPDSVLTSAQFVKTNLRNADFTNSQLWGAHLTGSKATKASFEGASLIAANLQRATLSQAKFKGAELDEADLRDAVLYDSDFAGASLRGTHLEGVNLSRAKGLTSAQLDLAVIDHETKIPEDLRSKEPAP